MRHETVDEVANRLQDGSHSVAYTHLYNCQQHLDRYGNERDALLNRIITGDETWIHHCEPESKLQSMEWKHPQLPSKRSSKVNHQQKN
jgi:hypothetical protein